MPRPDTFSRLLRQFAQALLFAFMLALSLIHI